MAIQLDHAYEERVEGDTMPIGSGAGSGDNCRDFRAITMAASDSNEPESDTVHDIDTYKYAPEWVPTRATRVVTGGQSKTVDPGTK